MAQGSRRRGEGKDSAPPRESTERSREDRGRLREWVKSLLIAFALFLFIRTFFVQTFVITSGSMEDTLLVGDMLVANRLAVGARLPGTRGRIPGYAEPKRGEVVIIDPHHQEDIKLAKRVIGLPGDTLAMRSGTLSVNGNAVEEPYLTPQAGPDQQHPDFAWQAAYLTDAVNQASYRPTHRTWGPLVVPAEHYFVMGDHRDASLDSRHWGPLAAWRIEARVAFVYFSYNKDSYRPFPALREIRWRRLGRRVDAAGLGWLR